MESYDGFDWQLLHDCTYQIMALAGALELWTILGSTHPLSAPHKPHNSLYIISHRGQLLDRYDKRFCAGDASETTGDLAHYTSGTHLSVFAIKGLQCGTLICHDYRYPELYRAYKRRGVQLMFHSYHAAHMNRTFQAYGSRGGSSTPGVQSWHDLPWYYHARDDDCRRGQ